MSARPRQWGRAGPRSPSHPPLRAGRGPRGAPHSTAAGQLKGLCLLAPVPPSSSPRALAVLGGASGSSLLLAVPLPPCLGTFALWLLPQYLLCSGLRSGLQVGPTWAPTPHTRLAPRAPPSVSGQPTYTPHPVAQHFCLHGQDGRVGLHLSPVLTSAFAHSFHKTPRELTHMVSPSGARQHPGYCGRPDSRGPFLSHLGEGCGASHKPFVQGP